MSKRRFELTPQQSQALLTAYNQCRDGATKIRYQAVRLYGTGEAVTVIQRFTNCGRTSLMEWVTAYQQAGLAGLRDKRAGGNCAKLTSAQRVEVTQYLQTYTPRALLGPATATASGVFWTVADLHHLLQRRYGVTYQSRTSLLARLARAGLSYHRPERVFKSQRPAQVLAFDEQLEKNCSTRPKPRRTRSG